MKYIYVNQNGVKLIPCDRIIPISEIHQRVVGNNVGSSFRVIYCQFSHHHTVIVCNHENISNNVPIMGITRSGIGIKGAFVIASLFLVEGKREFSGMSQARIEIALREIQLVRQ